jgi:TolA-binding protein
MSSSTHRSGHDGRSVEDDAWFDDDEAMATVSRERRTRMVLALALVLLVVIGLAVGAFSSDGGDHEGELTLLRDRAKAASTPTPLSADGQENLLTGLERLVTSMPAAPAPVADAAAAASDASGDGEETTDGEAKVEEVDAGPVAAAVVEPPKPEPKPAPAPAPAKPNVATFTEPKAAKPNDGKSEPAKATNDKDNKEADDGGGAQLDPKLKGPVDQALAEAKVHLTAGRWSEARASYDKVLKLAPGHPRALLGRGRALLEQRQVKPALKDIKAVIDLEPKNPTALLLAGSISQELGQKAEARGYYQRYLDAWPSGRKATEVRALLERL